MHENYISGAQQSSSITSEKEDSSSCESIILWLSDIANLIFYDVVIFITLRKIRFAYAYMLQHGEIGPSCTKVMAKVQFYCMHG